MYCGSCLHGNTLAAALRASGEDVMLVPLYTPLRTDEENVSVDRVAFGGINVYLQQRSALFRRLPGAFDRLFESPRLLRWLGRRSSTTRPELLGKLTVSMLRGEQGRQRKELEKLVDWLKNDIRPQVVHLSNALLSGTAREISRSTGAPVVCTLSGEDLFLERLPHPYCQQARDILRRRVNDLSALVAMNGYYADFMTEYLAVPRERIHVIRPGLNLEGHAQRPASAAQSGPVAIGFLARICPGKGLHLLAEAFRMLAGDEDLPPLMLRAAGYLAAADRPYLDEIRRRLRGWGLAERFEYLGELDRQSKIAFLQSLRVMSLPAVDRESKGLPVLEAWANAVPVVVPNHGAFAEMIEDTGGGLLFKPDDAASLAEKLGRMIRDRDFALKCGTLAQQAVHERYNAQVMARSMIDFYKSVLDTWPGDL